MVARSTPLQSIPATTVAAAGAFIRAAKAENTRLAYASDWRHFEDWCRDRGHVALPAAVDTLVAYFTELAKGTCALKGEAPEPPKKASTIQRRLSALSFQHRSAGYESPRRNEAVLATLAGIRHTLGTVERQARPLLPAELHGFLSKLPPGIRTARDRAILLLAFAGAFRESEVVALEVADLDFQDDRHIVVTVRKSKTDQVAAGREVPIIHGGRPLNCPVRMTQAWMRLAGITKGPLFRPIDRHKEVGARRLRREEFWAIVKRVCGPEFSGHSLRAGFVTASFKAGHSEVQIMRQTGHTNITTLRKYIRGLGLFENHPGEGLL